MSVEIVIEAPGLSVQGASQSRTSAVSRRRHLLRWTMVAIVVALAGIWTAVLLQSWKATRRAVERLEKIERKSGAASTTRIATTDPVEVHSGPWGDLEITKISIAPPAEFAAKFHSWNSRVWHFRDAKSSEAVEAILKDAGLTDAQIKEVLKTCAEDADVNGMSAKPELATLLAITPQSREKLYRVLGQEPKNHAQADTFRYRTQEVDEWLVSSVLPPSAIQMVRQMTYERDGLTLFSDASQVLDTLGDDKLKGELFKMLARQSAVVARLRIKPDSDLKALATYWGRGREEQIMPVLESMAAVPGGCVINISLLLPRFAKERVYTYPQPTNSDNVANPYNCHWSSMNFFNDQPDDKFLDPQQVARELSLHYRPVMFDYQFGDVIFFENAQGGGIHSVVYIADDVVFTKNGGTITAPWKLSKLSDITSYYESMGEVRLKAFRRDN